MPALAADAAKLAKSGALVGMGSHGDEPGIGFHYEMEAHTLGGMKPMAVLHAATAGAAETIGRLADMGTLEPGKYADLVIFDDDPLIDIRNTMSVKLVMRGGQLFDADTLDELWPTQRKMPASPYADTEKEAQWLPMK
jgi:imidazolonepropionase-like amidohydrolase